VKTLPWVLAGLLLVLGAALATWLRIERTAGDAGAAAPFRRIARADGSELVIPKRPEHVVPANAGAVDAVARLIGPDRVAALPEVAFEYSFLAQDADGWRDAPRFTGYTAEPILAAGADLVVSDGWQSLETTSLLRRAGVPVVVLAEPEDWEGVLDSLRLCGEVLGEEARALELRESLEARVRALRATLPGDLGAALSYSNFGTGGWAAGAGTTADVLFDLVGMRNAAAEAGLVGHVSVDVELLLSIDPDWIVVEAARDGSRPGPTEAYLTEQDDLRRLRAVREQRVIPLPPSLFTTSSIEIVTGAELLAARLRERRAQR